MTGEEYGVADWVIQNNKRAGATTNTLSNAHNLYLAVRGTQGVMGIVAIPSKYYPGLEVFEKNLTISIINECGLILERRRLQQEKQDIEMETQQERLRSNLLRAISHDLRTPLTSISGNAGILMEKSIALNEEKKQELQKRLSSAGLPVYITSSVKNRVETVAAEAGKAGGLKFLRELLGIPREETAAFGDGDNDIDMLEEAGIPIAMANASEACRAAAAYVTRSNQEDGVAWGIYEILRIPPRGAEKK